MRIGRSERFEFWPRSATVRRYGEHRRPEIAPRSRPERVSQAHPGVGRVWEVRKARDYTAFWRKTQWFQGFMTGRGAKTACIGYFPRQIACKSAKPV